MAVNGVLTAVLAVFTAIAEWFVTVLPVVEAIFWAEGALTFIGVLAVCSLAIAVVMMLMAIIRSYLNFTAR